MEVGNTDQETLRYRVISKASTLTSQYAQLMAQFDKYTPEQFDARVEEIIDEIEQQEIRLKKQQIMFNVTERDQAYYEDLIGETN